MQDLELDIHNVKEVDITKTGKYIEFVYENEHGEIYAIGIEDKDIIGAIAFTDCEEMESITHIILKDFRSIVLFDVETRDLEKILTDTKEKVFEVDVRHFIEYDQIQTKIFHNLYSNQLENKLLENKLNKGINHGKNNI